MSNSVYIVSVGERSKYVLAQDSKISIDCNQVVSLDCFRHTGFLESFHNHLLMYCPKRHAYS